MFNPVSTYRIQFHKGFTFRQFDQIIPYLQQLGIKTVYASPIFKAVPGSMHGYDVTDPLQINPEIGTLNELKAISKKLKKVGISWLQDIVPNHMAFHPQNEWLMDVLENGKASKYAAFFDVLWDNPAYNGQLMVPFLGKPWQQAVADKEITIIRQKKRLMFDYFGQPYPLNEQTEALLKGMPLKKATADSALIDRIADAQYYRLCFWQETDKQINFRRFFTVNGLICLNMQDEKVFDSYHALIRQLVKEGIFQGLRVDHVDGLFDPKTYLERLREMAGPETYIVVEKILERGEKFPSDWPVEGNTGYDFLAAVNNLLTFTGSRQKFTAFYRSFDPAENNVHQSIFEKKRLILYQFMQGELENLHRSFLQLQPDADNPELKETIGEVLVYCPVYRFYQNAMPLGEDGSSAFEDILKSIEKYKPALSHSVTILRNALLKLPTKGDVKYNLQAQYFYSRLMQFAGPLMAKGVEDTLMYSYNRFIDHNEVGDSPEAFGIKADQFHQIMVERQKYWPLALNATATHDTKRGEDVRARLNVLSDIPDKWIEKVQEWQKLNKADVPDANDEYFIYQTIAGAYPMPGEGDDNFQSRLEEYLEKALREAKQNSNWATPNERYEKAVKKFAVGLLNKKGKFWKSFKPFHRQLCDFGIVNSLAQTLLKYTCPGTPDLYQGCELWDLSLVDPDNRRPVNYPVRENFNEESWQKLWETRYNGHIKLQLTQKLLAERAANTALFTHGEYIPLTTKGRYKEHIFAFARYYAGEYTIVLLPLNLGVITDTPEQIDWHNTRVQLPQGAPLLWQNSLTGKEGYGEVKVSEAFAELPVAMLRLQQPKNDRAAGVLMHITSLPSAYGVGDVGPEAYQFADFLQLARQKYWQVLPVNPISLNTGFSPYSSTSVMAGNPLLISPDLLYKDGLLTDKDLQKVKQASTNKVDFLKVTRLKQTLFSKAWHNFKTTGAFEEFKNTEAYWLDDFALYETLKRQHQDKPWYQWPAPYKNREKDALNAFQQANAAAINEIKWLQFVFAQQWQKLKAYCKSKGISMIGDLPFYASYDSVDVWTNPELFKLDNNGNMAGIAGVPPDYFSATGQLWGMPVYNWDSMKADGYSWWLKRIKKNLQYFDLIRLDHFRAFSAYWEVPGGSMDAINGKWQQGPGAALFDILQKKLGELPFIAEDLGDIDETVYELRDKFKLPGMRVLQFAFDEAMSVSPHIPHNYTNNNVAYTGTHDNNTIRGWFKAADKATRKRVQSYTGKVVKAKDVHLDMIRLCYASTAKLVIIPMQDLLGDGDESRMNVPSAPKGNWAWRSEFGDLTATVTEMLGKLTSDYNR